MRSAWPLRTILAYLVFYFRQQTHVESEILRSELRFKWRTLFTLAKTQEPENLLFNFCRIIKSKWYFSVWNGVMVSVFM